ncbi:hypothetical protein HMN09_00570100 [Mycena chlorophos]|uniref:Yeast cell wall synthesis Kre9/Knh1-like N-terminal domain-containing protein n=1 Tax=Mycena chlorophos TaxID=658473 RepID=A0A8H6TE48_MYCCL|nr:hypothetical protein HMN09_00570100 [Mycena chlorophos]
MLAALRVVVALCAAASVHALSNVNLKTPSGATGLQPGQMLTMTWDSDPQDPQELTVVLWSDKDQTFSGPIALANDVDAQSHTATFEMPDVLPGSAYYFGLVSESDPSKVLASSSAVTLGAEPQPEPSTTAKPTTTIVKSIATPIPTSHSAGPLTVTPLPLSGSGSHSGSASVSAAHHSSGSSMASGSMSVSASTSHMSIPSAIPVSFPTESYASASEATSVASAHPSASGADKHSGASTRAKKGSTAQMGVALAAAVVGVVFFGHGFPA